MFMLSKVICPPVFLQKNKRINTNDAPSQALLNIKILSGKMREVDHINIVRFLEHQYNTN